MALVKNMALFFLGFLPAVAVASMTLAGVFGDHIESSPQWKVGWNPFVWLIMTAPWLLPTAVVVPLLHFLGKGVLRRFSRVVARRVLLGASPALFMVAVLALWGPGNFRLDFVLPVAVSGVLYGALQRIPD